MQLLLTYSARLVLSIAVCASFFVASPAGAQASALDEMSQQKAGAYYLQTICRANDAQNAFLKQIWRGRERIQRAEVARRLPEIRRASGKLSTAFSNASRRLFNPPADWPGYVANQIGDMRNHYLRDADIRSQQSYAATATRWLRLNGQSNALGTKQVRTSRKIRAILDLPPPGKGC